MEFLVHVEVTSPVPRDERDALLAEERARGHALQADGHLRRIWRVPGRWANISLYDARDATHLHELLTSLPLWPYMTVRVEPLASHPLED